MTRVFDATAISSTQRFANRMQSGIFPPQSKWCRLDPGQDIPADRRIEAQAVQGSPLAGLADLPVFDDDNIIPLRNAR